MKNTTTKQYHKFNDIHGNAYGFADYTSFATWFFGISRRVMVASLSPDTFKRLNYEATNSREARKKA